MAAPSTMLRWRRSRRRAPAAAPLAARWRYLTPLLIFVIGICLTIVAYLVVRGWDQERLAGSFDAAASTHAQALQRTLDDDLDVLYSVRNLSLADSTVSRADFTTFLTSVFARHPGIQAVEWLPRVPENQRTLYEDAARADGLPGFTILDRTADGKSVPAAARADHFPVYYVAPLRGNQAALGIDAASLPDRRVALDAARDSGQPVATGRITLIQEQHQGYSFLVFVPVYQETAPATLAERQRTLRGFVLGAFRVQDLAAAAFGEVQDASVGIEIRDPQMPAGSQVLYRSPGADASHGALSWSGTVQAADRRWDVHIVPTAAFLADRQSTSLLPVLVRGALASAAIAAYALSLINRSRVVERLVSDRTEQLQREVQERERAERLLAGEVHAADEARGQARAILDAAGEAILLVAPDRRFVTVNRRFGELFPVPPEAIIGRRLEELSGYIDRIFVEPAALYQQVLGTASDGERRFTVVVAQRWPEPRELELFSAPVHAADSTLLGRIYAFRDVTRERAVDRMKSEFISLVSHELRTPLTSIKGYTDLLASGELGALTPDQQEFMSVIQANADRLGALINDFLDISRIESGKVELRCTALQLDLLIQGVATSLRPQITRKGQRLTLDLPPEAPAAHGDANRVTQILANLLSNATKYTPDGGAITLRLRPAGDQVRVDVQDDGIGLSAEEQRQLFTKFYRAKNRVTEEVGGTGLGLTITRSLIELHGGTLTVQSAPGVGSTFSFTLPAAETASLVRTAGG